MHPRSILGTLVVFSIASSASATDPIRYINDFRRCTAAFGGNGSGSTWQDRPVRFGNYHGGVTLQPSNGLESWLGESDQVSWMDGMAMALTATARASVVGGPDSHIYAQGQANFDIWFAADDAIDYTLSGELSEAGNTLSASTVTLTTDGGDMLQTAVSNPDAPSYYQYGGHLEPGIYHLVLTTYARAEVPPGLLSTATASSSLLFSAVQPGGCDADWNHDGVIDTFDFFSFTDDFLAGSADFNHSGGTDTTDFYDFLTSYFAGCH
jgi:hypothetical protein